MSEHQSKRFPWVDKILLRLQNEEAFARKNAEPNVQPDGIHAAHELIAVEENVFEVLRETFEVHRAREDRVAFDVGAVAKTLYLLGDIAQEALAALTPVPLPVVAIRPER